MMQNEPYLEQLPPEILAEIYANCSNRTLFLFSGTNAEINSRLAPYLDKIYREYATISELSNQGSSFVDYVYQSIIYLGAWCGITGGLILPICLTYQCMRRLLLCALAENSIPDASQLIVFSLGLIILCVIQVNFSRGQQLGEKIQLLNALSAHAIEVDVETQADIEKLKVFVKSILTNKLNESCDLNILETESKSIQTKFTLFNPSDSLEDRRCHLPMLN